MYRCQFYLKLFILIFIYAIMEAKAKNNLVRMIQLADEFFAAKNDPSQISVDDKVMLRLKKIHKNTITEKSTSKGPVAWILVIPTTQNLMEQFISNKISERQLLNKTPLRVKYNSIYLCSALVLPEYRNKGLAKRLMIKAIKSIKKEHPINCLFYWAFSKEGKRLAQSVSAKLNLPLHRRQN